MVDGVLLYVYGSDAGSLFCTGIKFSSQIFSLLAHDLSFCQLKSCAAEPEICDSVAYVLSHATFPGAPSYGGMRTWVEGIG